MFGKGGNSEPSQDIPVLTVESFPEREYDVIDTVIGYVVGVNTKKIHDQLIGALQQEAAKLQADAVLGFRVSVAGPAIMMPYGTAIKFK